MIGFIAIGKENPGTPYGQDDIDLLSSVASQSGSAIMRSRATERLIENKELDTFNQMSAFVLHDLKNAAGHLSLILQNAPEHMHQEEFQQDMLETVSEALARIDKVMSKLTAIPEREQVKPMTFPAARFLEELLDRIRPRLQGIETVRTFDTALEFHTDPDILEKTLENILVNAAEAVDGKGMITIALRMDGDFPLISISDNGIGMTEDFIREKLFKPFQTTKKKGTGLGMWQVKNMAEQLGAKIDVSRNRDGGITVTLRLPPRTPAAH
jgi:putative PEP-CTERM system histidine kinase